jgi:hypothetical protein
MPDRYYTVAEANAALTTLRPLVAAILAARAHIVAAKPDLWPVLEKAAGNGGSDKASAVLVDFEMLRRAMKTIEALGIVLKDANTGLVDFLSQRDGRDVYLCWRYDEPKVAFWHDLEAGFGGRQPLE